MTDSLQDLRRLTEELTVATSAKPDMAVVTLLQGGVRKVFEIAMSDLKESQDELVTMIALLKTTRAELDLARDEIVRLKQELEIATQEIARLRATRVCVTNDSNFDDLPNQIA